MSNQPKKRRTLVKKPFSVKDKPEIDRLIGGPVAPGQDGFMHETVPFSFSGSVTIVNNQGLYDGLHRLMKTVQDPDAKGSAKAYEDLKVEIHIGKAVIRGAHVLQLEKPKDGMFTFGFQ